MNRLATILLACILPLAGVAQVPTISGVTLGNNVTLPNNPTAGAAVYSAAGPTLDRVPLTFFGLSTLDIRNGLPPMDFPAGLVRTFDAYSTNSAGNNIARMNWCDVNTANGTYVWTQVDAFFALAHANNQKVIYTLACTPTWDAPSAEQGADPSGYMGNGSTSVPADCDFTTNPGYISCPQLINFVNQLMARYKGKIYAIEIWNEPNLTLYWKGTAAQLASIGQIVADDVHSQDGTVKVLTPAVTTVSGAQNWLPGFLSAKGIYAAYDMAAFHGYWSQSAGYDKAESQLQVISAFKSAFATAGLGNMPMIVTEGSWCTGLQAYCIQDLTQQSYYVPKCLMLYWTQGITSFQWYASDGASNPGWGRLVTPATTQTTPYTTLNPAGIAWQTTRRWMLGAFVTGGTADANGTYTVRISRPEIGYTAYVYWNSSGTNYTITLPANVTQRRDVTNAVTSLAGATTLSVGNAPVLVE